MAVRYDHSKLLRQSIPNQNLPTKGSIGGVISGTLGVRGFDNIFYVTDDLFVPPGQTLTITLGTSLVFASGQGVDVAGQLIAEGSPVFPIRFINTEAAGWAGLRFRSSAQGSRCLGCQLENLMTNTVALQVEAPITFQYGLIRDVPGGIAISSTVPFSLSNIVVDYVGTALHLSGPSTATHTISHLTLSRCQQGVVNNSQNLILANSILTFCNTAISTELFGTTTVDYSLFDSNVQNFVTEDGSQLVQGTGILTTVIPGFVGFPNDFHLRPDSQAVDAADPQAPFDNEIGYNGGRANMGAYGNSMEARSRPPLDQMEITLESQTAIQSGQPGQTVTYTLTMSNSGSVTETYAINAQSYNADFIVNLFQSGHQGPKYIGLAPQSQVSITVPVNISSELGPTTISETVSVRAFNAYVGDEIELTIEIPAFQESNGQVTLETEHFTGQIERSDRAWLPQTVLTGYVGSSYINAWPDTNIQFNQTYTVTSPELRYLINFSTVGPYTVWLRGYASNASGDSLYVALDDQPADILTSFEPGKWSWTNITTENIPIVIEVAQPGPHTLRLWQREDGLRVDRIVLTTDTGYNPSGNGPPESEIK